MQDRLLGNPGQPWRADAERLKVVVGQLMNCQSHWLETDHDARLGSALGACRQLWCDLQDALGRGTAEFPLEISQNILILSVYGLSRLEAVEHEPSRDALGGLIALMRNLAMSLQPLAQAA